MRRWSGLCFGLAILFLCGGIAWVGLVFNHGAGMVAELGARVTPKDTSWWGFSIAMRSIIVAIVGGALACAGMLFWIREARAEKRVDETQVPE